MIYNRRVVLLLDNSIRDNEKGFEDADSLVTFPRYYFYTALMCLKD